MSFAAITRDATVLTVDVPPKIAGRFDGGLSDRSASITFDNSAVVVEWAASATKPVLRLRWEALTGAQLAILDALIDGEGPVTVKRYAADTGASFMFGARSEQKIETRLHPEGYPDTLADGSAQLAARTWGSAELTLYRL